MFINVKDLKYVNKDYIIDIRNNNKYIDGHIDGSKNISYENLLMYPYKYLKKDCKYYIYCQKGIKSKQLCQILRNTGYDVLSVVGGYEEWLLNNN